MIRRAPRPDINWTVVRNEMVADPRISFKATGILVYILSKPDNWQTSTAHLASIKKEGLDAIRTAIAELRCAGYVRTRRYQDSAGKWRYETDVFDTPQSVGNLGDDASSQVKPQRGFPREENGDVLLKTERTKTMRGLASTQTRGPILCGQCHGHGKALEDGYPVTCPSCNGDGIG
jgi:hypothetical protein